ncbi:MAG: hypothetical protein ABIT68_08135, partial [Sphingomicrobium sp.]
RCAAGPVPHSLCALTTIDELKGRLMMLKTNHGSVRRFTGLLLAGGVTLAGLALAMPAAADDSKNEQVSIKEVVIRGGPGGDALKSAAPGDLDKANCPLEKVEIVADGGSANKKEQAKFILCGDRAEGRAGLIKGLEKAAADLQKKDEMPSDIKADMLAKIRAKIESLRAGG